jgi:hypothetical protein
VYGFGFGLFAVGFDGDGGFAFLQRDDPSYLVHGQD